MEITFNQHGLHGAIQLFEDPADQVDNLEPVFRVIARKMMRHEERVFETAGASAGEPWQAIEPNTIAAKRRSGSPNPARPLSDTLRLMRSLTVPGHPDMILEITESFIRYGTSVPYATYHQTGTRYMDEREPILFTAAQANDYWDILQRYIFRNELAHAG